jgi:hypothetical protein
MHDSELKNKSEIFYPSFMKRFDTLVIFFQNGCLLIIFLRKSAEILTTHDKITATSITK